MYNSVMVVDDSKLERFITEKVLNNIRFAEQVILFNSGIDALAHLQSLGNDTDTFPDMIFLDIHMPLMNGFEFLDKFLEFPIGIKKHCKIVIISSTDAPEDHMRMKKYPIIHKFLSKPLSEKELNDLQKVDFS